jgi:hypothetical protein
MTIEETLKINFDELLSCFDDEGEIKNGFAENAQCCLNAINEAVDRFTYGVTTVAHHGFNLNGHSFHTLVKVDVSCDQSLVSLEITCDDSNVSALYIFDATMNLVMTKTNDTVSIE